MKALVSNVAVAATGRWTEICEDLGINIPKKHVHGPCPTCGGKDRFKFDDKEGRGTWFCNQCSPQAGDGIDLVANVNSCNLKEAAVMVASLVGILEGDMDLKQLQYNKDRSKAVTARQNQNDQERLHEKKRQALEVWISSQEPEAPPRNAPYLIKKDVGAYGVRLIEKPITIGQHTFLPGAVVVPRCDTSGEFAGVQLIDTEAKRHIGPLKGSYHLIGQLQPDIPICIVEGYADGATIFELTGQPVAIAFSTGGLKTVSAIMRDRSPNTMLYFAADKDPHGAGEIKAFEAAAVCNGLVVTPPFQNGEYGDWNDYMISYGKEITKASLDEQINLAQKTCTTSTIQSETVASPCIEVCTGSENTYSKPDPLDPTGNNTHTDINYSSMADSIAGWQLMSPSTDTPRLVKLNSDYVHTSVGGKHVVISRKPSINGTVHVFEVFNEFKNYFLHLPPITLKAADGKKSKRMTLGEAWLHWPDKSFYPNGIGFYPRPEKTPAGVYNLYTEPSITPIEGDCSLWLTHLRDIICNGNEVIAAYSLQWLAHMIQKPDEKPSVAIVLKSVEGTGKGSLIAPLLTILGAQGIQINGSGQIAGRFNNTIANKILIFADEVDLTNKDTANILKGIISESTINLERKGIDPEPIPNYARLIFASNHDRVIRAGLRERRYLVLEPSDSKAQDKEYFSNLWNWINQDGPTHLLHLLQNLSLDGFDPRRCPVTDALIQEKLASLAPVDLFLYEQLSLPKGFDSGPRLYTSLLISNFQEWCLNHDVPTTLPRARSLIGKRMSRIGLISKGRPNRDGGTYYELPALDVLRQNFAESIDASSEEIF